MNLALNLMVPIFLHTMLIYLFHIRSLYFSSNHFGVTNRPPYLYGTFTCFGYDESLSICPRSSYNSLLNCGDNATLLLLKMPKTQSN